VKARPVTVPSLEARFHRPKALAQELDLSLREIYREIAEGTLIVHRFGRSLRISESDKQAYLEARRCAPNSIEMSNMRRRGEGRDRILQNPKNSYREDTCK
jgi:excisionase family DNA binding protein